jgi:hypothetical protein
MSALVAALVLLLFLGFWMGSPPAGEPSGESAGRSTVKPPSRATLSADIVGASSATDAPKPAGKSGSAGPTGDGSEDDIPATPKTTHATDNSDLPPGIPVPELLRLVVVDAATGEAVVGARVLLDTLWPEGFEQYGGNFGSETADGGAAVFQPMKLMLDSWPSLQEEAHREVRLRTLRERVRLRVRVLATGYQPAETPVLAEDQEIRLFRDNAPRRPARVEGRLRRTDGTPGTGRLRIEMNRRETGSFEGMWTFADAGGAFTLEGLEPGACRLGVYGVGQHREFVLVEGETAVWDLVSDGNGQEENTDVRSDVTRHVVVEVGPIDASLGGTVRAEARERHSFRSSVVDGRASFPTLPVGAYRFVLVVPGATEISVSRAVEAGEEPLKFKIE